MEIEEINCQTLPKQVVPRTYLVFSLFQTDTKYIYKTISVLGNGMGQPD